MSISRRRGLTVGGLAAGGAILAGASAAFACVAVVGQITVDGTIGRSVSIANGNHPGGNVFCVPPTTGATAPQPTGFAPNQRPLIKVSVGPVPSSSPCQTRTVGTSIVPNAFGDSSYDVMYCDGAVFKKTGGAWDLSFLKPDRGSCFFTDGVGDRAVLMGTMTVSGGTGSGEYRIPAGAAKNGPNNAAGIAVRETGPGNTHPGAAHVNIAAISII